MISIKTFPAYLSVTLFLALTLGCADGPSTTSEETASTQPVTAAPVEPASPVDLWWAHLQQICGKAFQGKLVSSDEVDAKFLNQPMTMHVRRCAEDRIEIPFHIDQDRSRTWVLTRNPEGIKLQHDHRHEDGSEDEVTLYGGLSSADGSAQSQNFPADAYSRELFEQHELTASVTNVWSMELVAGERFSYILRRPGRHFQADFDLSQEVEPPPAPWGHD